MVNILITWSQGPLVSTLVLWNSWKLVCENLEWLGPLVYWYLDTWDLLNSFNLVEHSHLFVYFTSLTSYYLGLFTSFTYFDFSASKIRKSDQKCLFSHIDGRQNVQQKFCMWPVVLRLLIFFDSLSSLTSWLLWLLWLLAFSDIFDCFPSLTAVTSLTFCLLWPVTFSDFYTSSTFWTYLISRIWLFDLKTW